MRQFGGVVSCVCVAVCLSVDEFLKHFNSDGTAASSRTTRVPLKVTYDVMLCFSHVQQQLLVIWWTAVTSVRLNFISTL